MRTIFSLRRDLWFLHIAAAVTFACAMLLATCAVAEDDVVQETAQIHWLSKPGPCQAAVGDLIVVTMTSNPSTGPSNPAAKLKTVVEGTAVRAVTVVFVPPARPMPGAPGKIRAYFVAEKPGRAVVRVTPISGARQPGRPWEFNVSVRPAE
jgi:hypothetical protein